MSGFCRFDYPYRYRPDVRFGVFLIRHGDANLATLRPIPTDIPEMEYLDEKACGALYAMGRGG